MKKTIEKLKSINTNGPGNFSDKAPTGKFEQLFSIRESTLPLSEKNLMFINKMNSQFQNDFKHIPGIDRFYFDLQFARLELLLRVDFVAQTVTVEPYIHYDYENVGEKIQQIICREFRLYCLLKKWDLQ